MTSPILPSAKQFATAIKSLEVIWDLVPRSARPLRQKLKDLIDRTLEEALYYTETQTKIALASAPPGVDGEVAVDQSPLMIVMRIMRTLTPEQFLQVRILMMLRELSDEGRREIFDELEESHHLECGAEVYSDEPHDDCPFGDDPDGDGDEGVATDADGSRPALTVAEEKDS